VTFIYEIPIGGVSRGVEDSANRQVGDLPHMLPDNSFIGRGVFCLSDDGIESGLGPVLAIEEQGIAKATP
jgi:hypothetical protein